MNCGTVTPLQAAWLPVREAIDEARRDLDEDTFAVFLAMARILVAKLSADELAREWRRAA
jgi:hypothetical protein